MTDICRKIDRPKEGRRFVIGDIHGCYRTFKRLVEEKLELKKADHLYLLGDYIDRGPYSKAVLDYIFELQEEGYQLFPLRGNHESTLLDYAVDDIIYMEWHLKKNNGLNLMDNNQLKVRYLEFFYQLPYYIELDDFLLVHAGFDFEQENPFIDTSSMLWRRGMQEDENFEKADKFLQGRRVIIGHQPVEIDEIEKAIAEKARVIPLDNGAVYVKKHKIYDHTKMGKLCAMNLDSYALTFQENIDM